MQRRTQRGLDTSTLRSCFFIMSGLLYSSLALGQSSLQASVWLTTPDRAALVSLQPRTLPLKPGSSPPAQSSIVIDDHQQMQTIDGFGFALTGGSAQLLMRMSPSKRHALLVELFGNGAPDAGVSYLRLSIGASDMNEHVFTYDDMPDGAADPELKHFDLGPDLNDVVPVLHEILAINAAVRIMATPWTAPSWMKTNGNPKGGSLDPTFYKSYANYLALYVEQMAKLGVRIAAITPQNEPLNPKNTPSMVMTAEEEGTFIKSALGPTFQKHGTEAKIILYDHNCDRPDYPLTILADPDTAKYVDGSGFHLYGGTTDAMTKVHEAYPQKKIYFTEQMVIDRPGTGPDLQIADPVARIVIGALSNWSTNVLLWNLAADPDYGPHTNNGGCPVCEGAITLNGDIVTHNLAFYTIAQISRFVPPASVRIKSTSTSDSIAQVAFTTQDRKTVLLVSNTSSATASFAINFHGKSLDTSLPAGAVATYVW